MRITSRFPSAAEVRLDVDVPASDTAAAGARRARRRRRGAREASPFAGSTSPRDPEERHPRLAPARDREVVVAHGVVHRPSGEREHRRGEACRDAPAGPGVRPRRARSGTSTHASSAICDGGAAEREERHADPDGGQPARRPGRSRRGRRRPPTRRGGTRRRGRSRPRGRGPRTVRRHEQDERRRERRAT